MTSPGISPIDKLQQDNTMITASRIDNEQYWIDGVSYSDKNVVNKKSNDESQILKSPKSYISASLPI